jgi:hypothetical protein
LNLNDPCHEVSSNAVKQTRLSYPLFQHIVPPVLQLDDVTVLVRHGWYVLL